MATLYYKRKMYRSLVGCCICGAKSSSSRFVDSRNFEADFVGCFRTMEPRSGEICNACVLIVKRWWKLDPRTDRNWHHVVDARAGPGYRSMARIRNQAAMMATNNTEQSVRRPQGRAQQSANRHHREQCAREGMADLNVRRTRSSAYAPAPSPSFSDNSDDSSSSGEIKRIVASKLSPFLDPTYWKLTRVCCGIVFEGQYGEVMLDPNLYRPCSFHKQSSSGSSASSTSSGPSTTPAPSLVSPPVTPNNNGTGHHNSSNDRHSDGESSHSNESSHDGNDDDQRRPFAKEMDISEGNDEDTDIEGHDEEDLDNFDFDDDDMDL